LHLLGPLLREPKDKLGDPAPFVRPFEKPFVVGPVPFVWPLLLNEFEPCVGAEGPVSVFGGTAREVEEEDA
jgi:hypothetical protein